MSVVVKIPNKVKHEKEFNSLKTLTVNIENYSKELVETKAELDKKILELNVITTVDDAVDRIIVMRRITSFNNEAIPDLTSSNASNIQFLRELKDNIKREIQETRAREAALAAAAAQKEADEAATLQQQRQAQENAALELQHAQTQIQKLINVLKDQRRDITTNTLGDNDFTQFNDMNNGLDGFLRQEGISQTTKDAITGLKDEITSGLNQLQSEDAVIRREFETVKKAEIDTILGKIAGLDAASKETDINKLKPILASSNPPSKLGDIRERMDNLRKPIQEKQDDYKTKIANINAMVEADKYDFRSIAELNEKLIKLEDRTGSIQYVTQSIGKLSSKSIDIEKSPIQIVVELELDKASKASNDIILGSILQRAKADIAYFDEKLQNIESKVGLLQPDKRGEFKDRIRGLKSKQEEYSQRYKIQEERLNQMKTTISEKEIDVSLISPPTSPRPNAIARRVLPPLSTSKPLNEPPFTSTLTSTAKEPAIIEPPSSPRDGQLNSPRRALPRLTDSQGSASGADLAAAYELEPAENPPTGEILTESKPTASNTPRTGFFIPRTDSKDDPIYMVDMLDQQGGDIPELMSDNVTIRRLNLENVEDEDIIRLLTSLPHTDLFNDIELLERLRNTATIVDKSTLSQEQLSDIRTNLIVRDTSVNILPIVKNAVYKSSILKLISILDKPSSGIRRRRKTYIEMYEQIWKYFNYDDSLSVLKGLLDIDKTDKSPQPVTSETTDSRTSWISSLFKKNPNPATVAPTGGVTAQPSFSSKFNDSQLREILGWKSYTKNSLLDTLFSVFSDDCFEFNKANSTFLISQVESNDQKLRYCFMLNWIILLAFNAYVKPDYKSVTITIPNVGELIFNIHKSFLGWMITEKNIFQLLFTPDNPILNKSKPDYSSRIKSNIISDIRRDVTLDPLRVAIHRILCNLDHHMFRPPPPPASPSQPRPRPQNRLPPSPSPRQVSRPASPSLPNVPSASPRATPVAIRNIPQPFKGNASAFSRRVRQISDTQIQPMPTFASVGGKRTRKHKKHSGPTRRRNTKPTSEIGHKYTRKHTRT